MDARLPDDFYEDVKDLLPAQPTPGPQGGRPPTDHFTVLDQFTVLKVIWFVLTVGCRWKDVPQELGCCGETARTRLRDWEEAGIWKDIHHLLLTKLRRSNQLSHETVVIDSAQVRAFGGGDRSGPSPVDRRKKGVKYTMLVDRNGVPLAVQSASANTSDHQQILSTVIAFPQVGGQPGRPRERPQTLYADAGYDSEATRTVLRWLGIEPFIRRRNSPHGSRLGRIRWVVERTISWFLGLRRMRIRYDRHPTIIDAWEHLALAVICYQILTRNS